MSTTLIKGHRHDLGHGLLVQRSLPADARRMIGPFIFFDHAGPVRMDAAAARQADVRPHPHIGLSTLSYLLGGAIRHRDNMGFDQVIHPGDVNWMTAGRGVVHSERFDVPDAFAGDGLELLQSWIALPLAHEETEPGFSHHPSTALPKGEDDGVWLRLIAGEAFGMKSPVETHSPMFYVHTRLATNARIRPPDGHVERGAYVVHGRVRSESDGVEYGDRQLLLFGDRPNEGLRALEPSIVMLLGGEPLGTRYIWWNLVSSRKERIQQAAADWKAGRFRLPDSDNKEFIPLPDTGIEIKGGDVPPEPRHP